MSVLACRGQKPHQKRRQKHPKTHTSPDRLCALCRIGSLSLFCVMALHWPSAVAADTGAIQWFGRVAFTAARTQLFIDHGQENDTLLTNQQTFRLMLRQRLGAGFWSTHAVLGRTEADMPGAATILFSDSDQLAVVNRLRRQAMAGSIFVREGRSERMRVGYELDRAFYQYDGRNVSITAGRQPVDFGLGRLWQPLNVFGAFAPRTLDTDYKGGIDALKVTRFFGVGGAHTFVHVFGPNASADATAVWGRQPVGAQAQVLWLAASLPGGAVYGAGLESEWLGWGWRLEASYGDTIGHGRKSFWSVGADRQLSENTLITIEGYRHGGGFATVAGFSAWQAGRSERFDPMGDFSVPPLSWVDTTRQVGARDQWGVAIAQTLSPLVQAQWLTLAARLRDDREGRYRYSFMHQVSVNISLSNESDLLLAWLKGIGAGLGGDGALGSDYGHVPSQISARWRYYF